MMDQIEAARAVLIEVMNVLGAFKNEIVVVGGWVPDLKYPGRNHGGSLDVDLAIGPGAVGEDAYTTILARLKEKSYSQRINPTRFYREVPGVTEPVKVDLVGGEYVNQVKTGAIQVDELKLNSLRGVDLALEVCEEIAIEGTMPDGTFNVVRARIARPEAFILLKAFALAERTKDKDAYDIAFVLRNCEPTIAALAASLAPLVASGLGAEAYQILAEKFSAFESVGPAWAAIVAEQNGQNREEAQRAAFEDAQELFDQVQRLC